MQIAARHSKLIANVPGSAWKNGFSIGSPLRREIARNK
jgi:hypothetical protein